jgi:diacylglycerol O-acyltransferase
MHVGGLLTFETEPESPGRPGVGRIFETIEARLPLLPRCRQRLVAVPMGIGRPVWVEDPAFDIRHHLHQVRLPRPGTRDQLLELVAALHSKCLDRRRPLWEMYLVHGLKDGRTAVYAKLHHAMVDGASAVELGLVLLDLDPDGALAPRIPPAAPAEPIPAPGEMVAAAMRDSVGALALAGLQGWRSAPALAREAAAGFGTASPASLAKFLRWAPSGRLNGSVGHGRRVCCAKLPLGEIKAVKNRFGGTVNDVVLATIGEAISQYLARHGEGVEGRRYRVLVPVSVRGRGDTSMGNQVSAVLVEMPVGPMHPERRLWAVMQEMAGNKQQGRAGVADQVLAVSALTPAPLQAVASRLGMANQRVINMVVSNVPGVQMPVYGAGSRALEMYPLLPLAPNTRLVACVLSYNNEMNIGLVADRAAVPDLHLLEQGIHDGFARLKAAAGVGPAPRRRRARVPAPA